jgi:hypothetical protein
MKTFKSIFILISTLLFLITCDTDSPFEDFKICPERCPDDTPWESGNFRLKVALF